MNSKQTESNQEKQIQDDWTPTSSVGKTKSTKPTTEEIEAKFQEMFEKDSEHPSRNMAKDNTNSVDTNGTIESEDNTNATASLQTEATRSTVPKRISGKQCKESFEEYRQTFLSVPKLEDRKPVFISCEVRNKLDEIVRKLGGRKMSVSGFIENLARHHLETYQDDVELWKKL